ncbi:MAG: Flp pilus assembly protein TadB [uncultured Nocardioidaceae bacterium]|uniref:Flp pilus assembly protein TadB n=1 Tax=uncultured Nocardioidaceae bacterium TaxID=253824 RepID=A0A6J4MFA7_9ACTN|nr:MAG: Flp pilus assembly protein TadB [uncultured Nocardioidaceae bacterium]
MTRVSARRRATALAVLLLGPLLGTVGLAAPAAAASSSIDHVEQDRGSVQVVVSLSDVPDGVTTDLEATTVTFAGAPLQAAAQPLSDAGGTVRRVAVLAMDVSSSMAGARFRAAKSAAGVFLENVPEDVAVGLVTFAGDVSVAQEPTLDTEAVRAAVDGLALTRDTRLYDGLMRAVEVSGREGARSILVLSDGRDTSRTPIGEAIAAVGEAAVKVDVVALAQDQGSTALLGSLADAGGGRVLSADDPRALEDVFADEAEALAQQVLVTVTPPRRMTDTEGTLAVSLEVDGATVTDEAFVSLSERRSPARDEPADDAEPAVALPSPAQPGLEVPVDWMYAGLGAATLAVMVILVVAFGGLGRVQDDAVERSIEAYTRKGALRLAQANLEDYPDTPSQSMTQQAVAVAESVLEGRGGLESVLASRLESAGLALRPAEWLLVHVGVALGVGVFGLLLGGGSLVWMLAGLLFGVALPWLYLSLKKSRRMRAFNEQLADTLQLMGGSLSAGLSLAQSVDTVVREGSDPMAGEFRRALVEARLGVEIEEALSGVAQRMTSVDFEWVVMAIRIQREVGGNLSELLNKVADTIREREYLQRQVKTLSAEGRLSVWILGGLPPAFTAYLALANPSYVQPMFTTPLGWVMVVVMTVLLVGGVFWMKKVVKVEV